MKAVLDHTEDIALNIKTFWFKPEAKFSHLAGQYNRWYLPHEGFDGRGERRWFTNSASPSEAPLISITTKFTLEGGSSFKTALRSLKPGDELDVLGPFGDFVLPKDSTIPLVFIAGGIGVTPFRSMVKWLVDTGEKRQIQLIYAANKLEEVAFRDLFESYSLDFKLVLGEPPENWQGESGRLDGKRILELSGSPDKKLFFFSGPEPMVESLVEGAKKEGLPTEQIVTDFFPGYDSF